MVHQKVHYLEKLQVQIATAIALAAIYFLVAPSFRLADPAEALAFVPAAAPAMLARFAVLVWVLAAGMAIATIRTRPEGAMIATLIAAGGVSLRSSQLRTIFWRQDASIPSVYLQMAVELLVMLAILLAAYAIIIAIRKAVSKMKPAWVWSSPVSATPPAPAKPSAKGKTPAVPFADLKTQQKLLTVLSNLAVSLAVAFVLVLLLMRTPSDWHGDAQRGQVIFALLTACLLAVLIAQHVAACPWRLLALLMPIVLGIVFCVLAWATHVGSGLNAWISVRSYASALPIDWATAGCGGAMIGFWISSRMSEAKQLEDHDGQGKR